MCALSHDSRVRLFATLACEAPLSMRLSRQEYWSGLPCPPPGDLPHQGLEPVFPAVLARQVDSLLLSMYVYSGICVTESLCYTAEIGKTL